MNLQIKHVDGSGAAQLLLLGTVTNGAAAMNGRSGALADEMAARRYQSCQLADELRQRSDCGSGGPAACPMCTASTAAGPARICWSMR